LRIIYCEFLVERNIFGRFDNLACCHSVFFLIFVGSRRRNSCSSQWIHCWFWNWNCHRKNLCTCRTCQPWERWRYKIISYCNFTYEALLVIYNISKKQSFCLMVKKERKKFYLILLSPFC